MYGYDVLGQYNMSEWGDEKVKEESGDKTEIEPKRTPTKTFSRGNEPFRLSLITFHLDEQAIYQSLVNLSWLIHFIY